MEFGNLSACSNTMDADAKKAASQGKVHALLD
jgi:hypothetical protein